MIMVTQKQEKYEIKQGQQVKTHTQINKIHIYILKDNEEMEINYNYSDQEKPNMTII